MELQGSPRSPSVESLPRLTVLSNAQLDDLQPTRAAASGLLDCHEGIALETISHVACRRHLLTLCPSLWQEIMQSVNAWYTRKIKVEPLGHPATSSTHSGSGTSGSQYTNEYGTDGTNSLGYGAATRGLFDDNFDFLGSSSQGGHCVWLPSHMQMEIDTMNAYDFDWQP